MSTGLFGFLTSQRRVITLMTALLSLGGLWAALRLPSAIYPELQFSRVTVVVEGSALDARQVLFSITRPIEEAISVVPGVSRVQSRAIRGGSEINISFTPTTEMVLALQQVQARVNRAASDLPPGLSIEVERLTPTLFPVLSYNLEGGDPATLFDIARYQLKPLVSRVPGVGRVDVMGNDQREIEVLADPARLTAAGMTYDDLASAITAAITVDAVGRSASSYRQYLIVTATEAHSPEDVANVALAGGLHVRDVARVVAGTEDHVRIIAGDGRPAAHLNITRQPGGNTLAIADSVAHLVASLGPTLPAGVRLVPVYDQAALVRDAMASVRDAMLIGAALAVVVLLLFLRHARVTAISAAAIPLTMAISVFVMWIVGQTFNLMTLGAMAIAIGLVIDDAVVVTENIVRHAGFTPDRRIAVRDALQELIWPVTTSTLTTVVVFLPLGLLSGVEGQFFTALSITLTIAVVVSLVLALTLIPLLSAAYLRPADMDAADAPGLLAQIGRGLDRMADRYQLLLLRTLPRTRGVGVVALLLVALGVGSYWRVGSGFLPDMDEGAFVLDYVTPGGTALDETDRQLRVIEQILAETPEITATSRRTGAELGLFATEQNSGDIVARLRAPGARDRSIFEVIDDLRGRIESAVPRVRIEFVQILSDVINDVAGVSRPVELKVYGADLAALEQYATTLTSAMEGIDGLEDLYSGVSEPSAELAMSIDGAEAARAGLTPMDVAGAVRGALLGVPAGEVRLDDRTIGVRVRAPDAVRNNPATLATLPILPPRGGRPTPLGAVARFAPAETRGELLRENQQQMLVIGAELSGRPLSAVMGDVRDAITRTPPPAGIRLEIAGQDASQRAAFAGLLLVLALAAVSVVLVMVIQFQSFVEPLVVLLAAPLSFGGAIGLLLLTGVPLNVSSFMGLILLVGLIVKNGIILLDFTRHRMREGGLTLEVAIGEAARVRLRPILMTTLCTLVGLLPLALGLGAGSELQRPLALAVIGGLALSTPITLFLVPTLLVAIRGRAYTLTRSTTP